jgi:hypothetical protein
MFACRHGHPKKRRPGQPGVRSYLAIRSETCRSETSRLQHIEAAKGSTPILRRHGQTTRPLLRIFPSLSQK